MSLQQAILISRLHRISMLGICVWGYNPNDAAHKAALRQLLPFHADKMHKKPRLPEGYASHWGPVSHDPKAWNILVNESSRTAAPFTLLALRTQQGVSGVLVALHPHQPAHITNDTPLDLLHRSIMAIDIPDTSTRV